MQLIRVFFVAFIHFANICMSVVSLQPGNEMQTCAWGRELMYTQTEWYDSSHSNATNSHESLTFYYILIYFVSMWMCAYICMHIPMSFWVWRSAYNLALSTTVFLETELRFMPITQEAQSCPQFSVLQKSSFLSLSYYPQIFIFCSFFFSLYKIPFLECSEDLDWHMKSCISGCHMTFHCWKHIEFSY